MIDNRTALISTLSLLLLLASAHALLSVIPPHSLININIRPSSRAAPVLNHERTSSSRKSTILYNNSNENGGGGFFGAIAAFFEELDAFVDDATSRRLGSGSAFYGKRKSNFYGKKDKNRKMDRDTPNPIEDYQGPSQSGYFQWMPDDETGEMKPVTRLKKKNIERNPSYWDRVFDKKDD